MREVCENTEFDLGIVSYEESTSLGWDKALFYLTSIAISCWDILEVRVIG